MSYPWESELPALVALSDQEAADALSAMTAETATHQAVNYKYLAGLLSDVNYNALRNVIESLRTAEPADWKIRDMHIRMMDGGIDSSEGETASTISKLAPGLVERLGAEAAGALLAALAAIGKTVGPKYGVVLSGQVAEARRRAQ